MKKILGLLLLVPSVAFAWVYNIIGTEYYVNGMPPNLTKTEKGLYLDRVNIGETDAAIIENRATWIDTKSATKKVREIRDTPVVVDPIPCGDGFTGFKPDCVTVVVEPPVVVEPEPEPEPPVVEPPVVGMGNMPMVDLSKVPDFGIGSAEMLIRETTLNDAQPKIADANTGQFREPCAFSHMNNDDGILYPYQTGAAHHHTYFGNTSSNAFSDPMKLATTGTSTCSGGMANGSSYWMPSMIDTATKEPLKPRDILVYYKTDTSDQVVIPPTGLKMIANIKRVKENPDTVYGQWDNTHRKFTCYSPSWTNLGSNNKYIPDCGQGNIINIDVSFPTCWDGVNLDSPDHASHVMYRSDNNYVCPTGWKKLPEITYNVKYNVTSPEGTKNWRLSSDDYVGGRGGYSAHGDWVNGWDEAVLKAIVENCLQGGLDCKAELLGNGTPSQRLFQRDQYNQNTVTVPLRTN